MRFATLFTLGAAVVSTSASLLARQSLPTCAQTCTANANYNGCQPTDTHCLCTNQIFLNTTTQCIEGACTGTDLQTALTYSQALCLAVGVTLTATSSSTAASTSGTATSPASGTATSPATTSSSASAAASSAAAVAHGANAFVGLAAVGLVALVL